MENQKPPHFYPPFEEKINIITHAFGLGFSIIGLVLLILKALKIEDSMLLVSFSIFGASMILLYAASTFYHSAKTNKLRYRLNILDHASIYLLIAGTYTPLTLITLQGTLGWIIFCVVWLMAFTGIILKLYFTGRYQVLSTSMYVLMGWIIVFAAKPLYNNLDLWGIIWLFAGGVSYTLGAVFFSIEKIKFNHAIFHLFVLLGSFCHFMSIYLYVLPPES